MTDWTTVFKELFSGSLKLTDALALLTFPTVMIASLILFANAMYGYRLFKYSLALCGAITCGTLVYTLLLLYPVDLPVLNIFNIPVAAAIISAFIGGILMIFLHKLAVFVTGAGAGYFLGQWLFLLLRSKMPDVEFLATDTALLATSVVTAVLSGIVFLALFKLLYIITTSVGGMTLAGALVGSIIMANFNIIAVIITSIFGFVIGIFAAMKQFKDDAIA